MKSRLLSVVALCAVSLPMFATEGAIPDIGINPTAYIAGAVAIVAVGAGIAIGYKFGWAAMKKVFSWAKRAMG